MTEASTATVETNEEATDFALAWLDTWTDNGGSYTYDELNDKWWIGLPAYDISPVAADNRLLYEAWRKGGLAGVPEEDVERTLRDRRSFDQHWWEGKMRGLSDFLDAVSYWRDEVEAALTKAPHLGFARTEARPPKAE